MILYVKDLRDIQMNPENKHFHFIAIGGVGMSALAKYLYERGAVVTGSDIQESKYTQLLVKMGVKVKIGHDANLIKDNMIIVASSAIKPDNPEIMQAKKLNLQIYHRSDVLKLISDEFFQRKNSYFIGFSGTHGKTTTSGLASYVLEKGKYHPSFVVGGVIPEIAENGLYDGSRYFCAELDESDGTIQKYSTDIAVINNIEEDHLDYYKNGFIDIVHCFNKFLSNNPAQVVIINNDNDGNKKFMNMYPDYNYITFGLNNAEYTAKNVVYSGFNSEFDVYKKNKKIDTIKLSILGEHNVYNALAVYSALSETDVNVKDLSCYFYSFSGMGRRFQKVCECNGINIFDDYAHHPSEIKMTLNSVSKGKRDNQRLVAIFQPHRYTRLKSLWNDFKDAFYDADKLIILDVYPAGEDKIPNITSESFSKDINHKNCTYISGSIAECAKKIYPLLIKNDIVITLGAGNITQLGKLLEDEIKKAD